MARYAIRSAAYGTTYATTGAQTFRTRAGARRAMARMLAVAPNSGYVLSVIRSR